jgi:hypothetical protein
MYISSNIYFRRIYSRPFLTVTHIYKQRHMQIHNFISFHLYTTHHNPNSTIVNITLAYRTNKPSKFNFISCLAYSAIRMKVLYTRRSWIHKYLRCNRWDSVNLSHTVEDYLISQCVKCDLWPFLRVTTELIKVEETGVHLPNGIFVILITSHASELFYCRNKIKTVTLSWVVFENV